ncbi:AGE family epimerase/isomerase [Lysinimonas soli]|uniref:AGE family epimerase/isomerase n=1 Tax=Lysinimonas soli TaxID=1074233 RepID=A0ABW0NR16_9MICO
MSDEHDRVAARLASLARHLQQDVLPWWLTHGVDREYGGVFTFWGGDGTRLMSTDKYVWSQGRWIWTLASLARVAKRGLLPEVDAEELLRLAAQSASFVRDSAILEDGTCANFLTREGSPTLGFTGTELHSSVYADLFVASGFAALSRESNAPEWGSLADRLLSGAASRIEAKTARTAPYPVPPGFAGFGPPMILMNSASEVHKATGSQSSAMVALAAARQLRSEFFENGVDSCELRPLGQEATETVEARHRNPGHLLESLWFMLDVAEPLPGAAASPDSTTAPWLVDVLDFQCQRAWDAEFGGLFRFVDKDGGAPRGARTGSDYERTVLSTWDLKLWWPHTEAMYSALLLWTRTGDERALNWFWRLDEYSFSRFPAGPGREWNQILTRQGVPSEPDPQALLPVKDPFHLMRALLLLVEITDDPAFTHTERKFVEQ